MIRSHGGEYLAVPKSIANAIERVEGSGTIPDVIVLFRFPSVEAAKSFLESPEYRPYRSSRMAGSDSDIFVFENDDHAPQFVGQ
jgi:uncharacterized protein (DUF1330 family)